MPNLSAEGPSHEILGSKHQNMTNYSTVDLRSVNKTRELNPNLILFFGEGSQPTFAATTKTTMGMDLVEGIRQLPQPPWTLWSLLRAWNDKAGLLFICIHKWLIPKIQKWLIHSFRQSPGLLKNCSSDSQSWWASVSGRQIAPTDLNLQPSLSWPHLRPWKTSTLLALWPFAARKTHVIWDSWLNGSTSHLWNAKKLWQKQRYFGFWDMKIWVLGRLYAVCMYILLDASIVMYVYNIYIYMYMYICIDIKPIYVIFYFYI